MKPITVVIPNYNGAHLLRKNLPSVIVAIANYSAHASIIVVDDGSGDDSLALLNQVFPEVKVVVHEKNQGFAEAIHSGVNAADTELLFLLNSDVAVQPDIFKPLAAYFDDADTFSVNPLIYDEQASAKRHSWNLRVFRYGGLKISKWDLKSAQTRRNMGEKLPTLYAHGGSMMLRKSMFEALNGFDPIYKPFYSEDYDLGIRAWRNGWGSYFEPNVSIVHQSEGSIRKTAKMNYIKCIRRRNRYLLEWVHLTPRQLIFGWLPMSLMKLLGEIVTFDFTNIKAFYLATKRISQALNSRKLLNKKTVFSFDQVLSKLK